MSILLELCTTRHIGTKEKAKEFFKLLEKYDILPDKIGYHEPLKEIYSFDKAIEMWMFDDGVFPNIAKSGDIIGKKKDPNVRLDVSWAFGEKIGVPNYVNLWFTKKSFKQLRPKIEDLFKDMIFCLDAFYGYVSDYNWVMHQSVTGTIETRMPGIFWCNYFGDVYVNFFGKEKILNASWFKTEVLDNGGIIAYLTEEPDKELFDDANILTSPNKDIRKKHNILELRVKEQLGKDSFGEPWDEQAVFSSIEESLNYKNQEKNVPKLDMSEIRRPVSEFKE